MSRPSRALAEVEEWKPRNWSRREGEDLRWRPDSSSDPYNAVGRRFPTPVPRPDREVTKTEDGRFIYTLQRRSEEIKSFNTQQPLGVDELWIQHQRRIAKTTQSWACIHCPDRHIFVNIDELWAHALLEHPNRIPSNESEQQRYRAKFEAESSEKKRTVKVEWQPRKPNLDEERPHPNQKQQQPIKPSMFNSLASEDNSSSTPSPFHSISNRFSGKNIGHAMPIFPHQKQSVVFDFMCPTISKDNTPGEYARKSELLADFGERLQRHECIAISDVRGKTLDETRQPIDSGMNFDLSVAGMNPNSAVGASTRNSQSLNFTVKTSSNKLREATRSSPLNHSVKMNSRESFVIGEIQEADPYYEINPGLSPGHFGNGMRPPSPRPGEGLPWQGPNGQMVPQPDQGAGGVRTDLDPDWGRRPSGRDPNFGRLNFRG